MRDQSFICINEKRESLGLKLAPLTIEVPPHHDIGLAIPARLQSRQPRRKRRTRPASERFHDLYEATGEVLGEGSHGAVHCYIHKHTNIEYAVKIINKTIDYNRSKILKEIDIFHHCQGHKNILQLNEFYEESEKFYLVFDRLKGGSLFEHIQRRGHLTEVEASKIIRDLSDALDFLHHKGIAHRDLKPENILCESADKLTPVRICDFDLGSAIVLKQEKSTPVTTPELMTPVGSAEYMAPEVVDAWVGDATSYDKKCDLWSLGIILYIMLCGYPPFYAKCGDDCGWEIGEACTTCQDMLFQKIQDGVFSFPDREWSKISEDAKDMICHLLKRDPRRRYTAREVLEHPWISHPVSNTLLATPKVLSRNNSSQLLDTYAENAMAFNRLMLTQITISESLGSACSNLSGNLFFDSESSGSPKFFIGAMSDDEDDEEQYGPRDENDDEVRGTMAIPLPKNNLSLSGGLLKLSPPSSKLAERRKVRFNSVSLSQPSSPSL